MNYHYFIYDYYYYYFLRFVIFEDFVFGKLTTGLRSFDFFRGFAFAELLVFSKTKGTTIFLKQTDIFENV